MRENTTGKITPFQCFSFTITCKMPIINLSNMFHLYHPLALRHFNLFSYCVFYTLLTFCVKRGKKTYLLMSFPRHHLTVLKFNLKMQITALHLSKKHCLRNSRIFFFRSLKTDQIKLVLKLF